MTGTEEAAQGSMPVTQLRQLPLQFLAWFRQLKPAARWVVVSAAGLVLAGLLALILVGRGNPRWEPLFTRLDPADAAAIVSQLEEKGVPYQLAQGGQAILVPGTEVDRLRLELAAQGLPREGTVGLELMDSIPMGATEFERQVQYVRGLQGELARTISRLDGVEAARVHVVLPEDSPFVGQRRPATAAVLVQLKPGASLAPEQVRSIMHLVASAVEGLKPEDVTVVDTTGRLLSAEVPPEEGQGAVVQGDRFEIERRFEQELQQSLQTLLEQVLGPGNVIARVNAELNFDQQVIERHLFQPPADGGQGILRSIQELQETFTGQGVPVGVPGDSNIPTYPQLVGGTGQYQRTERTANYEINEVVDRVQVAPGAVRRLSVAVVVNGDLTPQRQQALQQAVAAAIGTDPQRQDQVEVVGMPFDTSVADRLQQSLDEERQAREQARRMALLAGAAVLALLALGLLVAVWRRRRAARRAAAEAQMGGLGVPVQGMPGAGGLPGAVPPAAPAGAGAVGGPAAGAAAAWANGRAADAAAYDQVAELVKNQPEHVAQVIRSWLAERSGN
ncbi:flagellar M-ring protein FliF [Thermaerobacter marianensis DSM 12885]|uniref:Flagellar M-ring protein n=1 Tax=Thermaerobacter marianensis (strain ATCC 700841 / DSM 12885 / JCM 10246 / 7p75a) TaxID=644966 RepID=E6SJM8_THEM7|nr:flagellar basal-body MS-ring/collar protein FliF [Thermaerobacter marianensis]ADU51091.1 flagellar M-ring protein FliF [Thermaerobacter marianensis DSM 12885]